MAEGKCRRIVRTIHGQMTGGDDNVFVCDDNSTWTRMPDFTSTPTTGSGPTAYLHNGSVCDHK
jgi:hypothetical protein